MLVNKSVMKKSWRSKLSSLFKNVYAEEANPIQPGVSPLAGAQIPGATPSPLAGVQVPGATPQAPAVQTPATQVPGAQTTAPEDGQATQINFEDLISKARQDEKAKLYPEMQNLKVKNTELVQKNNDNLITIGTLNQTIASLQKELDTLKTNPNKSDSDEIKVLKDTISDLKSQLSAKDTEITTIKLNAHKEKAMSKYGDELIPELIFGSTEEELTQSIEASHNRYLEIVGKVAGVTAQPASTVAQPVAPGRVPQVPSSNLSDKESAMIELENLDITNPADYQRYCELRKQLNLM